MPALERESFPPSLIPTELQLVLDAIVVSAFTKSRWVDSGVVAGLYVHRDADDSPPVSSQNTL
ncbi:MAG: hypothetical protein MUO76_22745, partial [Anaerolineaceae bacterium]|nr:hypothetical protein [Anaerolineaceae bacterium]